MELFRTEPPHDARMAITALANTIPELVQDTAASLRGFVQLPISEELQWGISSGCASIRLAQECRRPEDDLTRSPCW
jgi:hypothetical protein